jgi:hypothetical protein
MTEAPGCPRNPQPTAAAGASPLFVAWNAGGPTCTVLPTTADRRRFSRVSLKRSATLMRLPPFWRWQPSIGCWRMRASARAVLNSESRSFPKKTGGLRRADREPGRLLGYSRNAPPRLPVPPPMRQSRRPVRGQPGASRRIRGLAMAARSIRNRYRFGGTSRQPAGMALLESRNVWATDR